MTEQQLDDVYVLWNYEHVQNGDESRRQMDGLFASWADANRERERIRNLHRRVRFDYRIEKWTKGIKREARKWATPK